MRLYRLTPIALLALAACASSSTQTAGLTEVGYAPGSLGFAAIMHQDWKKAEAQLTSSAVDADDPARLLNLAHVYRKTGREAEARDIYRRLAGRSHHFLVELANGDVASTRELARQGLADASSYASLR